MKSKILVICLFSFLAFYSTSTAAHASEPDAGSVKSLFSKAKAASTGQQSAQEARSNVAGSIPAPTPERPKTKSDILSDLPRPDNATDVTQRGTRLSYTVFSTGTTIADFYSNELSALGWSRYGIERRQENSDVTATHLYRHDDDYTLVVTIADNENSDKSEITIEIR